MWLTDSEVAFVFDFQPLLANSGQRDLAGAMGQYWASFAASHVPSSVAANVPWPVYNASSDASLQLDVAPNTLPISHLKQAKCDFWDALA